VLSSVPPTLVGAYMLYDDGNAWAALQPAELTKQQQNDDTKQTMCPSMHITMMVFKKFNSHLQG
jgi:hypothetical protein